MSTVETESDARLVERALGGDGAAYGQLIGRHYAAVYRQACRLVDDPVEAQDLAQEAFLAAHLRLVDLRDPARFAGWLRRIAHTTCIDWHRQQRLRLQRTTVPGGLDEAPPDGPEADEEWPLAHLLRAELEAHLRRATQDLPERYRRPVALHHLQGMSHEQIAQWLGVPLGTVLSLVFRARSRLRESLNAYVHETAGFSRIELGLHTLPSRQGWRYRSYYQFLPGGVPEGRAFSLARGVLRLDNADLFPDNAACYVLPGVVYPFRPFALSLRARKLRETARFPEYVVEPHDRSGCRRNRGFAACVNTGAEAFELQIGCRQLALNDHLVVDAIDNSQFHEYRLEGTPGHGCRLFVDGVCLGSAPPAVSNCRNGITLGDHGVNSGNACAEIAAFSFVQMQPGVRAPAATDGGDAGDLLLDRPFLELGGRDPRQPQIVGGNDSGAARRLREVVRRCSRRWNLGRAGIVTPVDFAR